MYLEGEVWGVALGQSGQHYNLSTSKKVISGFKFVYRSSTIEKICQRAILVNTPENDLLKDSLGVCISKGAPMGPSHIFEVFHPAVEVAVLHKVRSYLHSVAVWDLLTRVAHRLSEQEVRPGK